MLLNVASPPVTFIVTVPESVPEAGFVSMASVICCEDDVTSAPLASRTCTLIAGFIDAPATTLDGCAENASFDAGPTAVTVNVLLVPAAREPPVALNVYPLDAILTERLVNVATPLTAETVSVPPRRPEAGLVPIATVTDCVEL